MRFRQPLLRTMFLKRSAFFLSYFSDVTKGCTSLQFQGSGATVVKINVHSLLSIHSLLPCLRLLAPEMNFTLNAPPMGINKDSYIIIAITTKALSVAIIIQQNTDKTQRQRQKKIHTKTQWTRTYQQRLCTPNFLQPRETNKQTNPQTLTPFNRRESIQNKNTGH